MQLPEQSNPEAWIFSRPEPQDKEKTKRQSWPLSVRLQKTSEDTVQADLRAVVPSFAAQYWHKFQNPSSGDLKEHQMKTDHVFS